MLQTIIFQCSNPATPWDSSVRGTCWPQHVVQGLGYTEVTLNIATDVFFAVVIPVPLFWNLNVNRRTRVSLIAVLGLGVLACAASIIKTVYLYNLGNHSDWLWDSRNISIWHAVELNKGVVARSLPVMRPLFRGVLGGSAWDREHHNLYLRSSQLGTPASSGKKSIWFRAVTKGRRPGAINETHSERTFNADEKDQDGNEPEPYELGYLDTRRSTLSTSFVTSGGNTIGGTVSAHGQGRTKAQWGIRKTSTTAVDFEDVVGLAK